MKRINHLWDKVISFENLYQAYIKARKGKKQCREVALFALKLEHELIKLQELLASQEYMPGNYRLFTIYERKPRIISAAPFLDRVVHHAVMNQLEPQLDKRFIYDSYACRQSKGVHAAVKRYQNWANQYQYVMKLDIKKYFPSIDRMILIQKFQRVIKDKNLLQLLDKIIKNAPASDLNVYQCFPGDDLLTPTERYQGIPIGNLTSQIFANFYLNELDHFIKEKLKVKAYLRYVDDMILLGHSKNELWQQKAQIEVELAKIRLVIHPQKYQVMETRTGVDILGYRVFPHKRLLRNDNGHRFHRKLKKYARAYARNKMSLDDISPHIQSWIGHAKQADTLGLRNRIFNSVMFKKS